MQGSPLAYLEDMHPNSRRANRSLLKRYLRHFYGEGELEELAARHLRGRRDHESDIMKFFTTHKGKVPTLTLRQMRSSVKNFLMENDIELPEKFWKKLSRRIKFGKHAWTQDEVPENEELRRILAHVDTKGKALFLTLESTGMKIGELLQTGLSDIDLDADPPRIVVRAGYTKTKESQRTVFMTNEAKEAIQEWLKERERYIEQAVDKSHLHEKTPKEQEDRLFPFQAPTAYSMWNIAIEKAGFDKKDPSTRRRVVHIHCLRKLFRSRLGTAIPTDIVHGLMGHEEYLDEAYVRHTLKELGEYYKRGEHVLYIFQDVKQISRLRDELEQDRENLQRMVNAQTAKSLELERKVRELGKEVARRGGKEFISSIMTSLVENKEFLEKLGTNKKLLEKLAASMAASISRGYVEKGKFISDEEPGE